MLYDIVAYLVRSQRQVDKVRDMQLQISMYKTKLKELSKENTQLVIKNRVLKDSSGPISSRVRDLTWLEYDVLDEYDTLEEFSV